MDKFSISENGYNIDEVNNFVNKVANEYEKTLNKLKQKDTEIENLKNELAHFHDLESTLNKAVMVAEDSSMQIKKVAREEARLIIDDAKKNASHVVNDALIKAEKVELEADQLRRSLKIYKSRIKQAISEQLTIVDDVDGINIEE